VTRYLLDTNIVSEALKPRPSATIAEWLVRQDIANLFIATLTVAEIWRGVLSMPAGRRRHELQQWFTGPEGPQALFRDRCRGTNFGSVSQPARHGDRRDSHRQ
jgi:hypothetical protein